MELDFFKYQGTGNDFVMIDGMDDPVHLSPGFIKHCCDRRFGIGADGLIQLMRHENHDFEMLYFNADGKPGSMCGNGGRCAVQFAIDKDYVKENCRFWAADGSHEAWYLSDGLISLQMNDVKQVKRMGDDFFLDTGSPHFVRFVNAIENYDVFSEGRAVRNNPTFKDAGTNVNFIEWQNEKLFVRTYERGVEEETLSCGTGVTASAIVAGTMRSNEKMQEIHVNTRGGALIVKFRIAPDGYSEIRLEGPAAFVFNGKIKV